MADLERKLLDRVENADWRVARAKRRIETWISSLAGSVVVLVGVNFIEMPFSAWLTITILGWISVIALIIVGIIGFYFATSEHDSPWDEKRRADKAWQEYLETPRLPAREVKATDGLLKTNGRGKKYTRVRRRDGSFYLIEKEDG